MSNETTTIAHHLNGFSSLERRYLCPGSLKAEEGRPDVDNEDNIEGTMLHEACATGTIPESFTMEQKELVERSIALMSRVVEENELSIAKVEEKLDILNIKDELISFGTPDFYGINLQTGKAVIIDHKFGRIKVEDVQNNLQMIAGAVAIWEKFSEELPPGIPLTVECIINQPRCGEPSTFTFNSFHDLFNHLVVIIKNAENENAVRVPGMKQCRYCKAKLDCEERMKQSSELMSMTNSMTSVDALLTLPPEQLSEWYEKSTVLKDAIKMLKDAVTIKAREDENNTCGNYKLQEVKGNRKIKDAAEAYNRISEDMSAEDFRSCCNITFGKLEDKYGRVLQAKGHDVTLKQAKLDLAEKLGELITRDKGYEKLNRIG